jgi:hypothetical protein
VNCLECQELLQRRLDGEAVDRAALERHLASCPECRERHAAAALLLEGLAGLPRPQPAPDLADRTAARVLRDLRARRLRRRLWVGLALAASLLLAVVGYLRLSPSAPETPPSAKAPPKVKAPAPAKAGPSLRESMDETRDALEALAGRIASKAVEEARALNDSASAVQFVSLGSVPQMAPLTQPLDATAAGLRQGGRGAAIGMRTVSHSARRAFNYFLRKMPPFQAAPKRANQPS